MSADVCRLNPTNFQVVTELLRQKLNTLGDIISLLRMVSYFIKYISNIRVKETTIYEVLKEVDESSSP